MVITYQLLICNQQEALIVLSHHRSPVNQHLCVDLNSTCSTSDPVLRLGKQCKMAQALGTLYHTGDLSGAPEACLGPAIWSVNQQMKALSNKNKSHTCMTSKV